MLSLLFSGLKLSCFTQKYIHFIKRSVIVVRKAAENLTFECKSKSVS